jgi:hypothetical protein
MTWLKKEKPQKKEERQEGNLDMVKIIREWPNERLIVGFLGIPYLRDQTPGLGDKKWEDPKVQRIMILPDIIIPEWRLQERQILTKDWAFHQKYEKKNGNPLGGERKELDILYM